MDKLIDRTQEQPDNSDRGIGDREWVSNRPDGGMTRREFATYIGKDSTTVGRWESGKATPSKDNANLFDLFRVENSIWHQK